MQALEVFLRGIINSPEKIPQHPVFCQQDIDMAATLPALH